MHVWELLTTLKNAITFECAAPVKARSPQRLCSSSCSFSFFCLFFFFLLGQHVQQNRARGRSLPGSPQMFSTLIKSDKPYCVYSYVTFGHSHTHPHWETLCYFLRLPGACHVCGNNESSLHFNFLLVLGFGESRVWSEASTSADLAFP